MKEICNIYINVHKLLEHRAWTEHNHITFGQNVVSKVKTSLVIADHRKYPSVHLQGKNNHTEDVL